MSSSPPESQSLLTPHQTIWMLGHFLGATFFVVNGKLRTEFLSYDRHGNMTATPRPNKTHHPLSKQPVKLSRSMQDLAIRMEPQIIKWLVSIGRTQEGMGPLPAPPDSVADISPLAKQITQSLK